MQTVLVHIDSDLGPIGAWSYVEAGGRLRQFYPESLDLSISGRARSLMSARPSGHPTGDWMYEIARSTAGSLCDNFEVVEVPDHTSLAEVVSEYRRRWNANV